MWLHSRDGSVEMATHKAQGLSPKVDSGAKPSVSFGVAVISCWNSHGKIRDPHCRVFGLKEHSARYYADVSFVFAKTEEGLSGGGSSARRSQGNDGPGVLAFWVKLAPRAEPFLRGTSVSDGTLVDLICLSIRWRFWFGVIGRHHRCCSWATKKTRRRMKIIIKNIGN